MNPRIDLILYLGVFATLAYLIYRYARYSKWEETDAGRAFMGMKICLLALVIFALYVKALPGHWFIDAARLIVVGGIWVSLTYQVRVMVRRQGGFRRNRPVQRWVPYHSEEPRSNPRDNNSTRA